VPLKPALAVKAELVSDRPTEEVIVCVLGLMAAFGMSTARLTLAVALRVPSEPVMV